MADKPLLSSSAGIAGQVSNGAGMLLNGSRGDDSVPSKTAVLERNIPWDGYQRVGLVLPNDFALISVYDRKGISDAERNALLEKDGPAYAELLLNFVTSIGAPETLQYVLTLIHELLIADPRRVELFNALAYKIEAKSDAKSDAKTDAKSDAKTDAKSDGPKSEGPYQPFLRLLTKGNKDVYSARMAAAILGILVSKSMRVPVEQENFLFRWINEQLRHFANNNEVHYALTTLQSLLSKDQYRLRFFESGDFLLLVKIIQSQSVSPSNFQLIYEAVYCAWLITYNEHIASHVQGTLLIPALVDVIKNISKEKVVRLAIATLRNCMDKAENNNEMIEAGFVRMLAILSNKKWGDDDIIDDLKQLSESLAKNIVVLSSYDMYKKELGTGMLTWSPVHKSEKFWRENATRFEENDFFLLNQLRNVMRSGDGLVASVACYDVGEFVRFHPRGKVIIQQTGIKTALMELMQNENPEVKKQALFAIQKTMVTNWEYLAKAK